jgi:fructokinase
MKPLIVGIGELLIDQLASGSSMGGAPANFLCHASALGARTMLVSAVGNDDAGRSVLDTLTRSDVDTTGVAVLPGHPTGISEVELDDEGVPLFNIHQNVAWDHLVATPSLISVIRKADAVCFGTLAQRSDLSSQATQTLVENTGPDTLRIFDLNLRIKPLQVEVIAQSLALADMLKLNEDELSVLSELHGLCGGIRQRLGELLRLHGLKWIVCTLGSHGSIIHDGIRWSEHPGCPAVIRDTVGAGDSFLATVTLGILKGWPLEAISTTANEVAAYVCAHDGAVPSLPDGLRGRFSNGF